MAVTLEVQTRRRIGLAILVAFGVASVGMLTTLSFMQRRALTAGLDRTIALHDEALRRGIYRDLVEQVWAQRFAHMQIFSGTKPILTIGEPPILRLCVERFPAADLRMLVCEPLLIGTTALLTLILCCLALFLLIRLISIPLLATARIGQQSARLAHDVKNNLHALLPHRTKSALFARTEALLCSMARGEDDHVMLPAWGTCALHQVGNSFALMARRRRLKFCPANVFIGQVYWDHPKVERVLANLLHNAIKFARSTVTYRVDSVGDGLMIQVCDDGPGFPAKIGGQKNLGLSIVEGIVAGHGGFINYRRKHNQTVVEVCFPNVTRIEPAPVLESASPGPRSVVVLLDDSTERERLRSSLPPEWRVGLGIADLECKPPGTIVLADQADTLLEAAIRGMRPILYTPGKDCVTHIQRLIVLKDQHD